MRLITTNIFKPITNRPTMYVNTNTSDSGSNGVKINIPFYP